MTNEAPERLDGHLHEPAPTRGSRQVLDPKDLRAAIVNWAELTREPVHRLRDQLRALPSDERIRELLREALGYPDPPSASYPPARIPEPLLPLVFRKDQQELRLYSTITTFGAPRNVALDELHVECWFPADDVTVDLYQNLTDRPGNDP